jgi:pyruvate formate lyase activating enzyme
VESGIIFDIQNLSLHDGPGLRTTIFFKGCPLRCLWCANPESQHMNPEIMFYKDKCISCRACEAVCPTDAAKTGKGCIGCGKCAEVCLQKARKVAGRRMTSEEVFQEILKDKIIYNRSNGGVTLSGGEVLMQPKFAKEILRKCKENGIHTVLDSTVYCKHEVFKDILNYVDLVYVDQKCILDDKHKMLIGTSNDMIIKNIQYMDSIGQDYEIRMPIIPGYNDLDEIVEKTIQFYATLKSNPIVWLLPFHAYGKSKYAELGRVWPMGNLENMERSALIPLQHRFIEAGIKAKIQ